MIICSCHAVAARTLRDLARAGADVEKVERCTRAGTSCGGCRNRVQQIVREEQRFEEQLAAK